MTIGRNKTKKPIFDVLWWKTMAPAAVPNDPPTKEMIRSFDSGIRHWPPMALVLSMPIATKPTAPAIRSQRPKIS